MIRDRSKLCFSSPIPRKCFLLREATNIRKWHPELSQIKAEERPVSKFQHSDEERQLRQETQLRN